MYCFYSIMYFFSYQISTLKAIFIKYVFISGVFEIVMINSIKIVVLVLKNLDSNINQ